MKGLLTKLRRMPIGEQDTVYSKGGSYCITRVKNQIYRNKRRYAVYLSKNSTLSDVRWCSLEEVLKMVEEGK